MSQNYFVQVLRKCIFYFELTKRWQRNTSSHTADSETYRGRSVAGAEGGAGIGVFEDRDGLVVKNRHHIRHMRGKYTMKEEIVKQMEISHPCKLTSTAVKISFPGMKSEVLVSFLGYKEPNLMFVNRCKGLCEDHRGEGERAGPRPPTACVPTKRLWKKVNMQIKTQYLGRDVREKMRELVLEEHEGCECRCLVVTASQCMRPGRAVLPLSLNGPGG